MRSRASRSLQSGEADIVWDDEYDADNIQKAQKDPKLTVHTYAGSGAQVYAFNTKVAPFDDVRVRQALVMAIDRKKMSQAITNGLARPASNPYGDGSWVKCKDDGALPYDVEKAKALIKDYGKPVDFKMIITATPRGRTVGQVLQQFWKQVGANMEIEQIDQATIVPRAFMRQFQLTPWRIIDLADPDPQMYANFHTGSPVALANYSNPELDHLLEHARVTADPAKRTEDYCAISRLINQEAIWFWTFQNTYYAISSAKLKGLPKIYGGVIDVSERLDGIIADAGICRPQAPLSGAGSGRRIAADLPDRFAAAGRSRLCDPRRSGDPGQGGGAAPRHGARSADLVALSRLARPCAGGRLRPLVPHRTDRAAGRGGAAAGLLRTDAAGRTRGARDRHSLRDCLRGAQRAAPSTAS